VAADLAVGQENLAAATNNYWQITGVQLELGNVASDFDFQDFGTELAACQRYYIRYNPSVTGSAGSKFGPVVVMVTTTIADSLFSFPVQMRTNVASIDFAEIGIFRSANAVRYDSGGFTLASGTTKDASLRYTHGSGIFTAGETGLLVTTGSATNPFVGFSAEL
jgi:hypothetical protein